MLPSRLSVLSSVVGKECCAVACEKLGWFELVWVDVPRITNSGNGQPIHAGHLNSSAILQFWEIAPLSSPPLPNPHVVWGSMEEVGLYTEPVIGYRLSSTSFKRFEGSFPNVRSLSRSQNLLFFALDSSTVQLIWVVGNASSEISCQCQLSTPLTIAPIPPPS